MQSNQSIISQRGVSALEFTIIAPLLFVLIFGLVEFGILFYDKAMITNASREGARAGIVYVPNQCQSDMKTTATSAANAYLNSGKYLIYFSSKTTAPVITPTIIAGTGGSNEQLQVSVTWTYYFLVFSFFSDWGWGPFTSGGIGVNAVSTMVVEQNPAC